ncbi:sugar transferase [Myroides odoratimimus subsp. xuanwuensis]
MIVTVVIMAGLGRERLDGFAPGDITSSLSVAGPLMVALWVLTIAGFGGYANAVFGEGTDEFRRVANASLSTAAGVGIGCYLLKFDLSRGFYVLAFVLGPPALLLTRRTLRYLLHQTRRTGALQRRVLIAGTPGHIDEVAHVLNRESWLGYHVVGALTPPHDLSEETPAGVPVLGNADDVHSIAVDTEADVLFIAGGALSSATQMRRVVWDLEPLNVQVVMAPSVTDVSRERMSMRPAGGLPLIHIEGPRAVNASRWAKRSFDVISSAALLILVAPLLTAAALWIRINDRGPVLFRQTRIGREGREFVCLKFRTMVTNAEELLESLHAEQGHEEGLFKMKDDPRITKPGKWLRRFSIDELPQLYNVLRGDMSLVGPRPPLALEVASYDSAMHRRLRVRPGLTGLWQVSGRSDLSWQEAIRLDLYYVDNWSMVQDLSILARTVGAVLRSRGAY